MKIGIFDPYLDTLGGGEKYMLTAAECLAGKHTVSIFWNDSSIKDEVKRRFNLNLARVKFVKNIFIKSVPLLSRLLLTRNYDLIIYLSDGSIPLVLTRLIIHFQFPVEWVNSRSIKTKIKFLNIKRIICNSLFTKSYIDKKFRINSFVLYPPAQTALKKQAKKENIILNVGRFGQNFEGSNYKKQDVMIEAFKQMASRGLAGWRLVLVVSLKPEDKKRLATLKNKAKGSPIEILENLDNRSLLDYYAKAKIYWHATGFGEDLERYPERTEHFGIATVEAMAQGCVPVVINAGGQKEIVKDGENGLLWNTIKELQDKTLWVIGESSTWQRLSVSAKLASQAYSKERFCEKLYEIIAQ